MIGFISIRYGAVLDRDKIFELLWVIVVEPPFDTWETFLNIAFDILDGIQYQKKPEFLKVFQI